MVAGSERVLCLETNVLLGSYAALHVILNSSSALAFGAALLCCVLALAVVIRKRLSIITGCFSAGMLLFAFESALTGMSFTAASAEGVAFWQTLAFLMKSFLPGIWLCFSLTYSRGNYREFLARSRLVLIVAFLFPLALLPALRTPFFDVVAYASPAQGWWLDFGRAAELLNALILISSVLILMNLERTFRSAVGTMRWRIKFLVLGLGIVFGARIYSRSQALLFSGQSLALAGVETGSLLIGCTLMAIAYFRSDFGDVDVYPSRAVLHTSLTVLLVGGYLLAVGVLAQIVAGMGGSGNFQIQAFLVLLAIVILAVLLLSDRFRQSMQRLLSRHFKRPQYDFRKIWGSFTQSMASAVDEPTLCAAVVKLISNTFNALSVTIWLYDEPRDSLVFGASTSQSERNISQSILNSSLVAALRQVIDPFNLENAKQHWAEPLRKVSRGHFTEGGDRIGIPLALGDRWLGLVILADRVGGSHYTFEEHDLLKCIGDQIAASLLNLRLSTHLMLGKEREAFQNISAFFVHDLKNTASTLNLMLQNLPVHFDDAAFREDALRGISKTAHRINQLIERLSLFPQRLELRPTECDLNQLVIEALESLNGASEVELIKELNPLPRLLADREQLYSVVTNLLLNARDATGPKGRLTVRTDHGEGWVALSVADNGCGMSPAFLRDSLFRPFRTTKKKGLGIGMFQSKIIIEAHRGNIQVKSEVGIGTTFRVTLPVTP
jgi:putative PEP-CTERM system histidine kinase